MAYKAIYLHAYKILFGQALKFVLYDTNAKDVLQESFIRIFKSLPKFQYETEQATINWMKRICTNEALSYLRKRKQWAKMDIDTRSETVFIKHELSDFRLFDLLVKLPELQRLSFSLFAIEGYAHKEISERLGIKENHSRVLLKRARIQLAKLIDQNKLNAASQRS